MSKRKPATSARERDDINRGLLAFIDASPTPFHAARALAQLLDAAGFSALDERDAWQLQRGGKYYVLRNDSSLVAWQQGSETLAETGWRMLGAHTDSPCLKIKPQPEMREHGAYRLGVEVYGGALLNPWFDRDLSIAGRVHFAQGKQLGSALVDFRCPVATIPSLAIHLDREANNSRSINPQEYLPVLLGGAGISAAEDFRGQLKAQLAREPGVEIKQSLQVLDYELSLYDTQPAAIIGLQGEFIAAARLDNLLSCYIDAVALIDACAQDGKAWSLLVCNDHEEVGSLSASGAAGPFLAQVLERIEASGELRARAMAHSMLVSTDNAHGLHPNFADKMEPGHAPKLNAGPVIKVNASQRYASNSETQALFRALCKRSDVPVQSFVVRSDMACGSTIGPITASELGVRTLDIGVPTFAMHSIRELAGSADTAYLYRALRAFYLREA
ncbi:MAG: M18 family aminopeptidase [Pseudomonadales bacterium]